MSIRFLPPFTTDGDERAVTDAYAQQDLEFCEAMLQAVEDDLEHPPMVGVDKRPCTKNPRFVPRREPDPLMQSIGGDLIEQK